jgi:hypothetical protein
VLEQPINISDSRRIYVCYYKLTPVDEEMYTITIDKKLAQDWANQGCHVVDYSRGKHLKVETVAETS